MKHTTMKAMLTAVIVAAGTVTALGAMPARYVPLDWLDTTGVQWILTDYVPKCTDLGHSLYDDRIPVRRQFVAVRPQV